MKARIISLITLFAGMIMLGCSRDDMPEGVVSGESNRVVFTLAGISPKPQSQSKVTRAFGSNDDATTQAATPEEKKVTSLLAVTYERQAGGEMGLYKVFDVAYDNGTCSFDIAKDGNYDMYVVANADETLADAIKGLEAGSAVSALEELVVSQAPDAQDAFVMTTPEAVKVTSYSGQTADCGEVTLRRLSVRIDLINKADGLDVTKVTFVNRAVKSQLFTPNAAIAGSDVFEDKDYTISGSVLMGSSTAPTRYESQIYSYENLSKAGESTIPSLVIEYTLDGKQYSHEVLFLDKSDASGMTPLALKRNYLYRVNIGRKLEPEFNIEVVDWTNDDTFSVGDVPFQAQMNSALAVSNFASANVKTLDEDNHTVEFTTSDPNNTSAYLAWSDKWATAVYYNESDATYYRVPTKDEMYLLLPDAEHPIDFNSSAYGTEITETLPENLFGSTATNGGEGKSYFKIGAAAELSITVKYPVVYAIRFKGTAQYAAYRYEVKNWDDPATGELEIRIKALQEGSLWSLDDIANEAYWGNPSDGDTDAENQLVYHIAATGYKDSASGSSLTGVGSNSLLWTSTSKDDANAYDGGHYVNGSEAKARSFYISKTDAGALRLVKATDAEVDAVLNSYLKVNMFTDKNANVFSLSDKTITSFYENEEATVYTEDSFVKWNDLESNGALNAEFTGPEGKKYRLPTAGEMGLLEMFAEDQSDYASINKDHDGMYHPYWNDNSSTNSYGYVTVDFPFEEKIYLKNTADNKLDTSKPDDPEYTVKGISQIKIGDFKETVTNPAGSGLDYNVHVAYALRFKGSSQYAAYRWESLKYDQDPMKRYMSIKIKALRRNDDKTTIETISNDDYWKSGYIEFIFPASGYYDEVLGGYHANGVEGYCWTSTENSETTAWRFGYSLYTMGMGGFLSKDVKFSLRFVKVEE